MNIECNGTIGIVHKKQKPYWYKRKGYYVGERWVKPKKIRKFKTVTIKAPYLSGDIHLKVDSDFVIGGVYVDDNGKKYMCCSKTNIQNIQSTLRIVSTNLGKTFNVPKSLNLIMMQVGESVGSNIV